MEGVLRPRGEPQLQPVRHRARARHRRPTRSSDRRRSFSAGRRPRRWTASRRRRRRAFPNGSSRSQSPAVSAPSGAAPRGRRRRRWRGVSLSRPGNGRRLRAPQHAGLRGGPGRPAGAPCSPWRSARSTRCRLARTAPNARDSAQHPGTRSGPRRQPGGRPSRPVRRRSRTRQARAPQHAPSIQGLRRPRRRRP